jgi:hypothetical protein
MAHPLIPGGYERNNLTYRQAGAMGGAAYGSDDMPVGPTPMSAATILERQKEGGGGVGQRRAPRTGRIARLRRWYAALALVVFVPTGVLAEEQQYRDFTLGASTAEVMARGGSAPSDLRTLHASPALIQELSWRPPYVSSSAPGDRDSVRAIVFSFIDDRLYRIAVAYDNVETEGLTSSDMIAALTGTYGAPAAQPRPVQRKDSLSFAAPVARWAGDGTTMVLSHTAYSRTFSLVIVSTAIEARARQAAAAAVKEGLRP